MWVGLSTTANVFHRIACSPCQALRPSVEDSFRSSHEGGFIGLGQPLGGKIALGKVGIGQAKVLDELFFQFLGGGGGEWMVAVLRGGVEFIQALVHTQLYYACAKEQKRPVHT